MSNGRGWSGTGSFTIDNGGTLRKSGGGPASLTIPLTNQGGLAVQSGQLGINGPVTNLAQGTLQVASGATLQTSGAVTNTGTVTVPNGGTWIIGGGGTTTFEAGSTLAFDGTLQLNSAVIVNVPLVLPGTTTINGTLTGTGDVTITGNLTTGDGTPLAGAGRLTVAAGATWTINNPVNFATISKPVTLGGTATVVGNSLGGIWDAGLTIVSG